MDDEITITEDQAEEAVMGWEVMGKLPLGWTRGTLASAYLILAARDTKTEATECNHRKKAA